MDLKQELLLAENQIIGNIALLICVIGKNSRDKGFRDKFREVASSLMLIVSELSEAMEADRKSLQANYLRREKLNTIDDAVFKKIFEEDFKDTFQDELADAVIRIFDLCEDRSINLGWHIIQKMRYNSLRDKMHGGKKY